MVSGSISLPSRGSFRLSLTVLVHYRSSRVFSLGGWSPLLPTGFHVSRGTQVHERSLFLFTYGTITPYGGSFQRPSAKDQVCKLRRRSGNPLPRNLQPSMDIGHRATKSTKFRLFPFRSPLLGESRLIYLPQGTEMFHFPQFPPTFQRVLRVTTERVAPFGNPRLGLLDSSPRLIAVLPRPSSALDAKASTMRPLYFNPHQTQHNILFITC
jgi:hypothetical protein